MSEREREIGDFDSRYCPGQDLSAEEVSVFQMYIPLQGRNSTLVTNSALLLGVSI